MQILYAVGLNETGRRGRLHPFALNIAGRSVFARSKEEAIRQVVSAQSRKTTLIDIGCMQINVHYHGRAFKSLDEMMDPDKNVLYAARFLSSLHRSHASWTMALARYHAGPDNNAAQKRYVCLAIRNMIAAGVGAWTPGARGFCQ